MKFYTFLGLLLFVLAVIFNYFHYSAPAYICIGAAAAFMTAGSDK